MNFASRKSDRSFDEIPLERLDSITPSPISGLEMMHFRRVVRYKSVPPVGNLEDARILLETDPANLQANLFMGWILLTGVRDAAAAVLYLLKATSLHGRQNSGQSSYLLGRAYFELCDFRSAHSAFQMAIWTSHDPSPQCRNSAGILFYRINQLRDSIEELSRTIRLNPYIWETWYNLGVLYDRVRQEDDALMAYRRCLDINPYAIKARRRLIISNPNTGSGPVKMEETPLLHVSSSIPLREGGQDIVINPIEGDD
ncbi:hypothetical protein EDB80DRAFT_441809 [Ilyonectria destructans]|nr:hypothetical protein EDB80DRAFT_441809 [Ilyonectria destructans]